VTKINVDAAISKNTGRAAAAAIARDVAGIFQGASVLIIQGVTDPESMEALLAILQSGSSVSLLTTLAW
jgi:phage tail sheath gpL-like